jgi:formate-dependent nitrite reductase membrane component NrfD
MFMSSLAIMAIAADRYRCIMQPDMKQLTVKMAWIISLLLGVLAIGMSIPLFVGTQLLQYVDFSGSSQLTDILLCSDTRSGDTR